MKPVKDCPFKNRNKKITTETELTLFGDSIELIQIDIMALARKLLVGMAFFTF